MPDQPPSPESLLQHGDFVRMLARSLVRDPARADDLAQDTWVAALEKPPRHDGNVRGWLARVTRNLAAMRRRGDWRRVERERKRARPEGVAPVADVIARLDWERRIVEGVRELDEPYCSTVVFRFFEHLEPAAIAKRMGVPRKTVYTRLERALSKLRARFDEQTGGERRAWCLALLPLAVDPRPVVAGVAAGAASATLLASKVGVAIAAGIAAVSFGAGWIARPEASPAPVPRTVSERRAAAYVEPATSLPPPASRRAGAEPRREAALPAESYVERLARTPARYHPLLHLAHDIADLPDEQCLAVMRAIFTRDTDPSKRRQLLKAFAPSHGRFHARALDVLDLATADPDPTTRAWAFVFLQDFAFRDFGSDPASYAAWRARWKGRPTDEVIRQSALEFVDRARGLPAQAAAELLRAFDKPLFGRFGSLDFLELPRLAKEVGLLDLVTSWLALPELGANERRIAHDWIHEMRPDEAYLRRRYLPALATERPVSPLFEQAARALSIPNAPWATDALLEAIRRAATASQLEALVRALGKTGDARAVPALIALVDPERRAMVEERGLEPLTGVRPDRAHDGAWWRTWWDRNRHFLPAEARHLTIPD